MPIVTQTRFPPFHIAGTHYRNGSVFATGFDDFSVAQQTTTSFRSGRGYDTAAQQYDAMTGEQLAHNVGKEYRTRFDNGNEFSTESRVFSLSHPKVLIQNLFPSVPPMVQTYSGYLYPENIGPLTLFPPITYPTMNQIWLDGTKGIARSTPTTAEASLGQFLGELREQLPQVVGLQTLHHGISGRSLGHEYLNVEYGIKPFVRDIQKVARSVLASHSLINQLNRDAAHIVRRKRDLHSDSTLTEQPSQTTALAMVNYMGYSMIGNYLSSWSSTKVFDTYKSSAYFKGAYTYYLDKGQDFLSQIDGYAQKANHLLGIELTPELVYQLTPWSWLLDWFSSVGDFFHNVTRLHSDSLVLRYGYVMHENHATRTRIVTNIEPLTYVTDTIGPSSVSSFASIKKKTRTRATPYGFGVDVSTLSAGRWAILGALGLTKSPSSLRYKS